MNYASLKKFDVANGSGIATTLFVSGCNFKCKGCHNKEAQNFNYGDLYTNEIEDKLIEYAKNVHVNHISILGGEPLQQDYDIMLNLLKRIKQEVNKPIWIWSGYTFEEILKDKNKLNIISKCDVLVDGRFVEELKDLNLKYKGSSNQRVIDVKKSLKQNKIILYEF